MEFGKGLFGCFWLFPGVLWSFVGGLSWFAGSLWLFASALWWFAGSLWSFAGGLLSFVLVCGGLWSLLILVTATAFLPRACYYLLIFLDIGLLDNPNRLKC